ncbi:methionyl-tRNA formyltransferase [Caldanaerobius fijiensis DSM 17918]|uniref:Methionyl-tRNA formyltransferase n=1 Tax=Caldanaerobius fijiensis DSM 17918 TaxID=1121256 RepID=A0A1M4ZQF7_9THEO|nr:methionyl-tRNA formyltransferase [Caldanaerobius fijiensis]SHF20234.1 methionyl-tRNA formyltransferase [Caldanaerobius fijiensis DSM 17918]
MKTVFMGTPDFAVPCLRVVAENTDLALVVTQPDRPQGRGHKLKPPAVKEEAQKYGLKVIQPEKLKDNYEFLSMLKDIKPDLIVVVAYGKILRKEVLDIPVYGCVNVHASLLPKYRGAAPINWAIINGEKNTGITTMLMDTGLDTGDILLQESLDIEDEDTAGTLHDKLKVLGAKVLYDTLQMIESGKINRIPQDNSESTYAPMLDKNTGLIDWNKSAKDIVNLIRGTNPWPGAFTYYEGRVLKIWKAQVVESHKAGLAGEVIMSDEKKGLVVCCGEGCISIQELQEPNSKKMSYMEYLRGHRIEEGKLLGDVS